MTKVASAEIAKGRSSESIVGNYFVSVYPPFSVWNRGETKRMESALMEPASGPLGIYVHIPFCQRKCDYCYYLSYIGQNVSVVNRYLEAVVHELEIYSQQPAIADRKISFAYFGGGTPSTLTTDQAEFLLEGVRSLLDWTGVEEITFEVAPRSVRPDFLKVLQGLGVNRISMGVQSFDNTVLKMNGRIHLARDVIQAYAEIREAGFTWVNLDLMCGLVGETPEQWRQTINETLKLSPDSVTIYQTEIPHNTQLYHDWAINRLAGPLASWQTKRTRLLYGFDALERAGYTIVSAYNAVKEPEIHHFKYQDYLWRGADMLGLGVASFGYFDGYHFQNANTLESYLSLVESNKLPLQRAYHLSDWEQLVREFILQLKFGEVDGRYFYQKFGVEISEAFAEPLEQLAMEGFLIFSKQGVRVTRAGLLRIDALLPLFYSPPFRDIRYT